MNILDLNDPVSPSEMGKCITCWVYLYFVSILLFFHCLIYSLAMYITVQLTEIVLVGY